jgi:hypothetical protein
MRRSKLDVLWLGGLLARPVRHVGTVLLFDIPGILWDHLSLTELWHM